MPVSAVEKESKLETKNKITGTFGGGNVQYIFDSQTFVAPETGAYRVRVWGGGGGGFYIFDTTSHRCGGGGGGFAMKEITLNKGDEVVVSVGLGGAYRISGGASSFGSFVSAEGGECINSSSELLALGGNGVGGDINKSGGNSIAHTSVVSGGGSGSLLDDGGNGTNDYNTSVLIKERQNSLCKGSTGGLSSGSLEQQVALFGMSLSFDELIGLDFVGAGRGSGRYVKAGSGGGGTIYSNAGFPGGGSGSEYSSYLRSGADGLVTIEY